MHFNRFTHLNDTPAVQNSRILQSLCNVIIPWSIKYMWFNAAHSSGVSVSVFDVGIGIRYFLSVFFYVGSVFGIGILKYRDIGIGIRYFAIIYNFWCNTATTMRVGSFPVHVGLWITLQESWSDTVN